MGKKMVEDNEVSPEIIADFFLSKKSMTQKKLQKLVYYAYAWFIALYNDDPDNIEYRLFKEQPEAWIHGPVFRTLYNKYHSYGWRLIPKTKDIVEFTNGDLQSFLETIWEKFGKYEADELESMTHFEAPWKKAREGLGAADVSNAKISDIDIFKYYNELSATQAK